jgi:hypothetical protein
LQKLPQSRGLGRCKANSPFSAGQLTNTHPVIGGLAVVEGSSSDAMQPDASGTSHSFITLLK